MAKFDVFMYSVFTVMGVGLLAMFLSWGFDIGQSKIYKQAREYPIVPMSCGIRDNLGAVHPLPFCPKGYLLVEVPEGNKR